MNSKTHYIMIKFSKHLFCARYLEKFHNKIYRQLLYLQQWFLTRGNSVSQETFGNVWRRFCLSQLVEVGYWHLVGRVRKVPKHPTVNRTASQKKQVKMAETEKPCYSNSLLICNSSYYADTSPWSQPKN